MKQTIIFLQREAPAKPPTGMPCNGCGACCALTTCPVARLYLWQFSGPCRALEWQAHEQRYRCGLLARPATYLRLLPRRAEPWFARRMARAISAGIGCDAELDLDATA